MTSTKHIVGCKACTKYVYCPDRSRDYPCRLYDSMYETAEEKLRNRVTVLLCKGTLPEQIEQEIRQNKTFTEAVKRQLLRELNFERG